MTRRNSETSVKLLPDSEWIQQDADFQHVQESGAIAGNRALGAGVGKMWRAFRSFLQSAERGASDNLIIAARDSAELLGHALFGRLNDPQFEKRRRPSCRKWRVKNVRLSLAPPFPWESMSPPKRNHTPGPLDPRFEKGECIAAGQLVTN